MQPNHVLFSSSEKLRRCFPCARPPKNNPEMYRCRALPPAKKIRNTRVMSTLVLTRRATYKTFSSRRVPSLSYPTLHPRSTKTGRSTSNVLLLFSKIPYYQINVRLTLPPFSQKYLRNNQCPPRTRSVHQKRSPKLTHVSAHVLHVFRVFSLQTFSSNNPCFQHCDFSKNGRTHA